MLNIYIDREDLVDDIAFKIASYIDVHGYPPRYVLLGTYEYDYYGRKVLRNLFGSFEVFKVNTERFMEVA